MSESLSAMYQIELNGIAFQRDDAGLWLFQDRNGQWCPAVQRPDGAPLVAALEAMDEWMVEAHGGKRTLH